MQRALGPVSVRPRYVYHQPHKANAAGITLKQWGDAETRMGGIEPMGEISLLTFLFIGLPDWQLPTRDPGIPLRQGVEWRIAIILKQEGTGMKRSQSTKSFVPSTFWT